MCSTTTPENIRGGFLVERRAEQSASRCCSVWQTAPKNKREINNLCEPFSVDHPNTAAPLLKIALAGSGFP